MVKDCQNRLKCTTCKGRHPTLLHHERRQEKQTVEASTSCGLTGAGGVTSVLSVVPITVQSKETGRDVKTYALLDSKSTAVFCSESLRSKLAVRGTKSRIKIQTINGVENVDTRKLAGLHVTDMEGNNRIELPDVYVQNGIPVNKEDLITKEDLKPWQYLQEINVPEFTDGAEVELLIGNNVPRALEPLRVIQSQRDGPYASQSLLGWEVHGLTKHVGSTHTESVHRVTMVEDLHSKLVDLYNHDFNECTADDTPQKSRDDHHFINMVKESINRAMAENRVAHLKRKFVRNPKFREDYTNAISETLQKGYAEKVNENETTQGEGKIWYIPHHGVYHPKKLKMRVVFDCAAAYHGVSLNHKLLQGPDLTNTLVGVMLRFRQEPVAVIADIQAMFNQVKVPTQDRDLLRFLLWQNGDTSKPLTEYRMTTHLFGATSSPACSNFALKQTAVDNHKDHHKEVMETINQNFYVDDCLKSISSEESAISLIKNLTSVLQSGGFRLTKWISNSRRVMDSISEEDKAKGMRSLNLQDSLPVERALGVLWSAESDTFGFKIELKDQPMTRRGILSTVSSIYDPLSLVAPAILPARQILQDLCRDKLGWDDGISEELQRRWTEWTSHLHKLEEFSIGRCLKPPGFDKPEVAQIHHFADASSVGYGTASYLRLTNSQGDVHCQQLMAKSRVAPLKKITIPRMELTAATIAIKIDAMLRTELQIVTDDSIFWTDSTTVLRYIYSESQRFHTFVANRVELIRKGSHPSQWRHVETALNPADECSRGQTVQKFLENHRWTRGPDFLWQTESDWPSQLITTNEDQLSDDPEVKVSVNATLKVSVNATQVQDDKDPIDKLLRHYSEWHALKKAVAYILRLRQMLLLRIKAKNSTKMYEKPKVTKPTQAAETKQTSYLSVIDLQEAEKSTIRFVQRKEYAKEINILQQLSNPASNTKRRFGRSSPIYRLDPVLDNGILIVGGRLGLGELPPAVKHPMILPKDSLVSELILRHIHQRSGHGGRNQILSTLQQKFWIIAANSLARKMLNRCVLCRRFRAKVMEQQMASLPADRLTANEPPFTKVGMDFFGPLVIQQGRSIVKQYGVVFVYIETIHIEKAASLDTDACINVIRRFVARRGSVKQIRSDNGTNLVGAESELRREIAAWNNTRIHECLLQKNIDWIFNPPAGSHHGGIWERQIRTIRKVMRSVVKEQILSDDNLQTLLCEIEAIVNNRPITRVPGEACDLEPLTPNHLLQLKCNMNLPPAVAGKLSQYAHRRWKQVQYLADLFWHRWTREYLPQLQERQKWIHPQRNAKIGDIVLAINEATPRNIWPLAKVIATMPGSDGLVLRVKVKTKSTILTRPINKLCLLLEADFPEQATSMKPPDEQQRLTKGQAKSQTETTIATSRARRTRKPPPRLDL